MVAVLNFPILRQYPADHIDAMWKLVAPFIQKALNQGSSHTLEDIYLGLYMDEMQLWTWADQNDETEIEAAMVTTIQEKDGVKWCLFLTMGGDSLKQWIHHIEDLEDWARQNGCDEMRIYGRIGWSKITGYDVKYTKMVKQL